MSAAAPVHALFQESCGGRVTGAAGGFADGASPVEARVLAAGQDGKSKSKSKDIDDPLLKRFVDAAQELVVPEGELASVKELAFAFQRAASRLLEVRVWDGTGPLGGGLAGFHSCSPSSFSATCLSMSHAQMASEEYLEAHARIRVAAYEDEMEHQKAQQQR
jgi:hypothetical protein